MTPKKNSTDYAFEVESREIQILGSSVTIPERRALVRKDTGAYLSTVSNRYKLVHHEEVVLKFEQALDSMGKSFKERKVTTVLPHNGARMYRRYVFPLIKEKITVGDIVNMTLELQNSYDLVLKPGFCINAMRLTCTNGLMMPEKLQEIMQKHFESLNIDKMVEKLEVAVPAFQKAHKKWLEWREEKLIVDKATEFLDDARIPQKVKDAIVERFTVHEEKSKWGMFQAATYVITHEIKEKRKQGNTRVNQITLENELASSVFYK